MTRIYSDAIYMYHYVQPVSTSAVSQARLMKREPSIDVRERILDAALRLVETRPEEFTMARVAEGAGVSRATVFRQLTKPG